ncbi:hypothetical protein SASPL_138551 [Salvia splendens]|uniref:Uncharacterized protein n=1 Tax=Salvia splendens TaxID=180675 RepID=A0A8X8ZEE4_SALSN|nr:uncharacterized protein LOC121765890 [Salvia splendens]KAG6401687.1 hypothetical protein SASPL_138551 [Salvia splendens]
MGNCQAIDSATLVIQHPNGRVDKLYWPVSASEIMKMNPGHYVALLLTTTLYSSPAAAAAAAAKNNSKNIPLRITRIKLLRPTDTLALGHVYRLVSSKEVMKGLWAKKQAKVKQGADKIMTEKISPEFEAEIRKNSEIDKAEKVKERQRSRNNSSVNSGISKPRGWQPSLKAISEAGS